MTFSVLARDPQTGAIGGAAATGNLAVGAWVLRVSALHGAVATQGSSVSTLWGDQAMALLADNQTPQDIIDQLVQSDAGSPKRQLAVLGANGKSAVFTGQNNHNYKGHISAHDAVFAGNWLSDENVLQAMMDTYQTLLDAPFATRLIETLEAGNKAGSDSRGTQSAALKILHPAKPPLDLRVDYHSAPIDQLKSLFERTQEHDYANWLQELPTLEEPNKC